MSNKLTRVGLFAGVGATGAITPISMRSKDQCMRELEHKGIDLGPWEMGAWVGCFVPPDAERWLIDSADYAWVPEDS